MQKTFAECFKEKLAAKEESSSVHSNASADSWETVASKKSVPSRPLVITFDAMAIVDNILKIRDVKKQTLAMDNYRNLYFADKSRLQITANIHQNGMTDVPHISARIWITDKWSHNLHFNGFISGETFWCSNITSMARGYDVETVCEF